MPGDLLPARGPRGSEGGQDQQPTPIAPLDESVRSAIDAEGFNLIGVTPAISSSGFHRLVEWIDAGYAAEMDYFANRLDAYQHPRGVLENCKTLIALALPYASSDHHPGDGAKVARYAWSGVDYHDTIHRSLRGVRKMLMDVYPGCQARAVVDTAPLMEREVAAAAGLGWRGKNTLLLNKQHGSYFFLACLLVDIEIQPDAPESEFATASESGHCGTCTACLDACPTDAFVEPSVMDANRCISYLTIEHRGVIEASLRPKIGSWIFGCDICQEVCPWNHRGRGHRVSDVKSSPDDRIPTINAVDLFRLDEDEFRRRFRKTPMWRTRRRGMLRNAAIVIANTAPPGGEEALCVGIKDDEPIVRGACVWALARLRPPGTSKRLTMLRGIESDHEVLAEIDSAISSLDDANHD